MTKIYYILLSSFFFSVFSFFVFLVFFFFLVAISCYSMCLIILYGIHILFNMYFYPMSSLFLTSQNTNILSVSSICLLLLWMVHICPSVRFDLFCSIQSQRMNVEFTCKIGSSFSIFPFLFLVVCLVYIYNLISILFSFFLSFCLLLTIHFAHNFSFHTHLLLAQYELERTKQMKTS